MFPVKEFEKRFRERLDALDAICEESGLEALEELNACFEDALFIIECINESEEEWKEEFSDALEEFRDLCGEYRGLAEDEPAIAAEAELLDNLIRLAEANLG